MSSIVRSQTLLHTFPLSDLKWSINSTNTPRFGSQADDSTRESPVGDSGVTQIESESEDRQIWTHRSFLPAAQNGVENSTEAMLVLDPAVAEKTASPSVGPKILIRVRAKEKSSVVAEEAEKQPPSQAQARAVVASKQEESTSRVWNLRPRKPTYKKSAPNSTIGGPFGVPHHDSAATFRKCTDISGEVKDEKTKKKKKNVKFSIALSKEEIEADFLLITGAKPPRRPKKRTRTVQKQLEYIFPGLNLPSAVTPQMYDVSRPGP